MSSLPAAAERGRSCPGSPARRVNGQWHRSGAGEPLHIVAGRALIALRSLRRVGARITKTTAALLGDLHERQAHRRCGFASFPDFAREALHMSPRTTKRRLALHRLLTESRPLTVAFGRGDLSICKVLALRPVSNSDSLPFWIELAQTLSVRELQKQIRAAVRETTDVSEHTSRLEHEQDDGPGETVTFAAPYSAAVAWDQGLDTARRVLGWEAPPHLCVEAILSEAEAELAHPRTSSPVRAATPSATRRRHRSPRARSPLSIRQNPANETRLRDTLTLVDRELHALGSLLDNDAPDLRTDSQGRDGDDNTLSRIRLLQDTERPLRVLMSRLLREVLAARAHYALGYECLSRFVQSELGVSERSGQRLLAEAFLFEDSPQLTTAFEKGRIGLGQAFLIHRTALSGTLSAFIDRAGDVTWLQFAREIQFLERLAEFAPLIWDAFDGPLPLPGLAKALVKALRDRGYKNDKIQQELRSRGLGDRLQGSSGWDADPAASPTHMRTLEVLLQLLILADEGDGAGRSEPPTLAPASRNTTVTFWATDSVLEQWDRSIALARTRWGPIPVWAAAVLILKQAIDEWERVDPKRRPSEARILERDDYRCQAPACSARRRLEVHHIVFRSHGGTDAPENKLTLCHAHHHHGIHDGFVRLSGSAPDDVLWKMGVGGGGPGSSSESFMTSRGSRVVARSGRSGTPSVTAANYVTRQTISTEGVSLP